MLKKIHRFLEQPAVYMNPHKNALSEQIARRKKFKPKVMLGDLRKTNCEFTSDLVQIAHNTRLVKRKMAETKTEKSNSLL